VIFDSSLRWDPNAREIGRFPVFFWGAGGVPIQEPRTISITRVRYLAARIMRERVVLRYFQWNQIPNQVEPTFKSLVKSDFSIALPYAIGTLAVSVGIVYAQRYLLTEPWYSPPAGFF